MGQLYKSHTNTIKVLQKNDDQTERCCNYRGIAHVAHADTALLKKCRSPSG